MRVHTGLAALFIVGLSAGCGTEGHKDISGPFDADAGSVDTRGATEVGQTSDADVAGTGETSGPADIGDALSEALADPGPLFDTGGDLGPSPDHLAEGDAADAPETVESLAPLCCSENGECPDGLDCVPDFLGGPPACLPPIQGPLAACWSDLECPPELGCAEVQGCPCGTTSCDTPPNPGTCSKCACCGNDGDCPEPLVCVGDTASGEGVCVVPLQPGEGGCWKDEDCAQAMGEVCSAGSWMSCLADDCGFQFPQPGSCLQAWMVECCDTFAGSPQCGEDEVCVPGLANSGKCGPKPGPGQCYDQFDCADPDTMLCEGMVTCWCVEGCTPVPGTCTDAPWNPCCLQNGECGSGYCAVTGDQVGVCLDKPPAGQCWGDADCGKGKYCVGELYCPCSTECPEPDVLGTCVALPGGCCSTTTDCPVGQACVGQTLDLPGRCLPDSEGPACQEGDCCWTVGDCPPEPWDPDPPYYCAVCQGATFCPCIEACPDCNLDCPADTMGTCGSVQCM